MVVTTWSSTEASEFTERLEVKLSDDHDFGAARANGLSQKAWDAFVHGHGGDIYMSYDWCRLWWEHYGKGRELRLFVGRDNSGSVIGLLPMFVETVWLGPVRLRWAKIIGCDFLPSVLSPVLKPPYAAEMLRQVITTLIQKDKCDAVAFGPLSDTGEPGSEGTPPEVRAACAELKDLATLTQDRQATIHTTFQLPAAFDKYLGGLNKRQKQNMRRDLNLFAKKFASKVDVVCDGNELEKEFSTFRKMHDQQWLAEKKLGHFGDWPGSGEFNQALVRTLGPQGRVRLVRLWANDQVVSYQYCLTFGDRLYWRLPARLIGEEWNRYGMGRLGLVKMIEAAISEGIRWIEGGPGHYEYKVQLGGQEVPLVSQVIVANSRKSRLCWKLFQKAADLLHLLYYRGWFLKLAPKLGEINGEVQTSALWPIWIRSRY